MKRGITSGYIDIHSHILAEVDDGSRNMAMSMKMLDIAYKEGIRGIIATPHYHPVKSMNTYEEILEKFNEFKVAAKIIHPDMKLYLGREVLYTSDALEAIERGTKLTMEGDRYLLVEYSTITDYHYIRASINNILQAGLIPIIAHIERYECMVKNIEYVEELRDMGAVIQVNAASILGQGGRGVKSYTKKLLKNQYIDVVATDAHSDGNRAPRMDECAAYIEKKYGQEYTEDILIYNPERIIEGRYLEDLN
ncbi:CpsB/CapC family capsule biosynthesis tyrosine phosphatase [[Clostridium] fimetarium]|uniref:protein-tyrosine-phosphatase n=1 Tax=[Clostridium] fimetarium TaxID=99656 RepID=A0A1I0RL65_9FIRM|nr:CpsB/CapC family capsule biosynthesis tyrosine phosphatase [[Clostridium] fimetarium]SEW41916.1 protein-tyrosine phosphatase [[Clostridium] fimetarium]